MSLSSQTISILHDKHIIKRKNPCVLCEDLETYKMQMSWIPWDDMNEINFEPITLSTRSGLLVTGTAATKKPIESGEEIEINGPYQQLERVAPIVQLWGYGYYHFIIEQLPKILRIARLNSGIPILTFYKTFHPAIKMEFIPEILETFKIKNPIVSYHPMITYLISEAVQTTEIMCGIPSPHDLAILRDAVTEISPRIKKNIGIFIKRTGRPLRSLLHHDKILDELIKLRPDVEWHVFDKMSFIDTIKLFSKAVIVVAPHGAGLANIVWASEGIEVIEIGSQIEPNICYWHISELLGNCHKIIISEQDSDGRFTISPDIFSTYLRPTRGMGIS